MAIDPRGSDLKRFLAADESGPVVMLNLLRFRPDGGRERYAEYVRAFTPFAQKYGAELVYVGDGGTALVAEPGQSWDVVLLVRYPDRAAFSKMVADPEYQKVTHLRSNALIEAVLQPTKEWPR
ncbi:DUF1330 domain-containing protein [Sandaracinus amylolyticus]|uniref:DUF1330 domain-containing protein n=1 Tax=Sandaracinus amylolyticus TaxID=927083 RepID=UPI003AF3C351|nr:Hypothetical protein I5071_54060 [Sandaracinus amylolyticus]